MDVRRLNFPGPMKRAAALLALALLSSFAGAQRGPLTRLIKEITINDESVAGGLTTIGSVVVGPGGSVYVAQPRDNVVLMFDSAGKFARKIGGRGQGPGETEGLSTIGFVGDTLWTYDFRGRRFAFFSPDGAYRSTLNAARIIDSSLKAHPMMIQAAAPLANGNLYYGGASYASHAKPILLPPHPLLIATREARVLDTVAFSDSMGRGSFGYE